MPAKKEEDSDIRLPVGDSVEIFYSDSTSASIELAKWCSNIFPSGWPLKQVEGEAKWPKYFLAGSKEISYPDVAFFKDSISDFGPGLYCHVPSNSCVDFLKPLVFGQKHKEEECNISVQILELLNPDDVFKSNVSQLCSDWDRKGCIKRRSVSVSPDCATYVFHPKIFNMMELIRKAKNVVKKVEKFDELYNEVSQVENCLIKMKDQVAIETDLKKEHLQAYRKIEEKIGGFDMPFYCSELDPEGTLEDLHKVTVALKEDDENLDISALKEIKKLLKKRIETKQQIEEVEEEILDLAEEALRTYDRLIVKTSMGDLHRYASVRDLSYNRSTISAIRLAAMGIFNNIDNKAQAKFKIHFNFVFTKNIDAEISLMKAKQFNKFVDEFQYNKGDFYDGFKIGG